MQSVKGVYVRLLADGCLTLPEGCRSRHSRTSHAPASSAKVFRILIYFKSVSIFIVTLRLYFYS